MSDYEQSNKGDAVWYAGKVNLCDKDQSNDAMQARTPSQSSGGRAQKQMLPGFGDAAGTADQISAMRRAHQFPHSRSNQANGEVPAGQNRRETR